VERRESNPHPFGQGLYTPTLRRSIASLRSRRLPRSRAHAQQNLRQLPAPLAAPEPGSYPVAIDPALQRLADACDRRIAAMQGPP